MSSLYAITDELLRLVNEADDGELTDEHMALLEGLQGTFAEKVDGVCKVIRSLLAGEEVARSEAARLTLLARCRGNAAERLKDYLQSTLERIGEKRFETDLFRVRVQANSQPSVKIEINVTDLPAEFQRVIYEIDRKALVEAHKSGKELPAGVTVKTGTHLRIS